MAAGAGETPAWIAFLVSLLLLRAIAAAGMGDGEWLGRLELLRLLKFLGRFLGRHGFSPCFGLPPGRSRPYTQ